MIEAKSDKLGLDKLAYDKLYFERKGFKKKNDFVKLYTDVIYKQKKDDDSLYMVTLTCKGDKEDEYTFEVAVTGFFKTYINKEVNVEKLIKYNTVNILYPYLRAAVTQLTSQPDIKPVILDPVDVIAFVDGMTDACEFEEKEEDNNDKEE